jgi:hypothetical protein
MSETSTNTKRRRVNDASRIELMIHHQFPGIELSSPAYASRHARCCLRPEQKVNVGTTMQAYFNINPDQDEAISILMCKLERININELSENETTCIQLLVVWKIDRLKRFYVVTYLMEHDKSHVWNRSKLIKLAEGEDKLFDILYCPVEETWLIHDNLVLKTKVNITHKEECYKLEITISEMSIKDDDTRRPWYIDMDR